jgi:Domain of unknown function (DUF397)
MNSTQPALPVASWRKSSYCDTGGQCVEVAQIGTAHLLRDSQNPDGGYLAFGGQAWAAFLSDIKDGAYVG